MPDSERDPWRWRQWELVHVQKEGDAVVLDVLELPDNPAEASDTLLTISLLPSDPTGVDVERLVETLSDWVASEATCGVLHRIEDPFGALALFQESQVLLFNTT